MISNSGNVFYKDEYDTFYKVDWNTANDLIDVTTITMQPYEWNKPASGKIVDGILFRQGIITIIRQVLRTFVGGYEIVAEGSSQYIDLIQMNFPCQTGPVDKFKHHLNYPIQDDIYLKIEDGPHWADPEDNDDIAVIWGDLNNDGSPMVIPGEILNWIDVWDN